MNLILLFEDDFVSANRVRLAGRRLEHVTHVHRAAAGDVLTIGLLDGRIGRGVVLSLDPLELEVTLDREPPPKLPLTLVVALPRPKVLNRIVAATASMGVRRLCLINAWRVEKSYWSSPRLSPENLRAQSILGIEQSRDTVLPLITTHRLFRRFVEDELPSIAADSDRIVAHPSATDSLPRHVDREVTLVIGPEGGFIEAELASLERANFRAATLGERILRTETAIAAAISRLF
jgi:16S rRNA (uracil1498-N3)-methyltransferase